MFSASLKLSNHSNNSYHASVTCVPLLIFSLLSFAECFPSAGRRCRRHEPVIFVTKSQQQLKCCLADGTKIKKKKQYATMRIERNFQEFLFIILFLTNEKTIICLYKAISLQRWSEWMSNRHN